jgi:hypothetical protein
VVLMGLAAQRFLALPERSFTAILLGSPVTLSITDSAILGALLAGLVASGTEAVLRAHPNSLRARSAGDLSGAGDRVERINPVSRDHWVFWGLPIALTVVALLLLPLAPSVVYWVIGLITMGLALGFSLAGIYYTVDPFQPGYRRARLGLNALRSLVSATEVMVVSGLLALELLRGSGRPTVLVALYAGITGLVLGQATWALNYWRLDSLTGGLVLMISFYNIVGLAQHGLQGRIRRRVVLEYGLITVAALALIWEFAP